MNLRIRDTTTALLVIGYLQLVGGILGLVIIVDLMLRSSFASEIFLLIVATGSSLFMFSLICGFRMLRAPQQRMSMRLSVVKQYLQVFQINIVMDGLAYSSGLKLTVGIKNPSIALSAGIFPDLKMSVNRASDIFLLINIVPIVVIVVLFDILKERQAIKQQSIATHAYYSCQPQAMERLRRRHGHMSTWPHEHMT